MPEAKANTRFAVSTASTSPPLNLLGRNQLHGYRRSVSLSVGLDLRYDPKIHPLGIWRGGAVVIQLLRFAASLRWRWCRHQERCWNYGKSKLLGHRMRQMLKS